MVAAVRVGHEAFGALAGPLHRAAHLAGRPGDDRLFGVVVDLRAEAAADIRRHDAQLVLRDVQHEGAHQQPDHMRVLAGGVQREVAGGGVEVADRGARLHGVRDQAVVGQVELHDLCGAGEHAVHHRLVADVPVVAEVAGDVVVHLGRARGDGVRQARDRRQVGVVDRRSAPPRPSPPACVSAITTATGSPTWRTLPTASTGCARLGHRRAVLVVDLPAAGQAADALGRHVGAGEHRAPRRAPPRPPLSMPLIFACGRSDRLMMA